MKDIKELPRGQELLSYLDVVIDGPFVEKLHDYGLKWRRFKQSDNLEKEIREMD